MAYDLERTFELKPLWLADIATMDTELHDTILDLMHEADEHEVTVRNLISDLTGEDYVPKRLSGSCSFDFIMEERPSEIARTIAKCEKQMYENYSDIKKALLEFDREGITSAGKFEYLLSEIERLIGEEKDHHERISKFF